MRQPDKRRYLDAVHHIERPDVPFQEDEIEITVAAKILGKPLPIVRSYELPIADVIELARRVGNDLVYQANVWELGRKNHFDAQGRKHYVDGTIKTRADLSRVTFPDLGTVRRRLEETRRAIEGTGLGLKYTANQPPFIVTTAVGYEDYYACMLTDPGFILDFQKLVEEQCLRELEVALDVGVDVFQVSAVICSKTGPLFRREMIEEFEYRSLRQRVGMARARGVPVSLHIDGDVTSLIPDFLDMGISVLNPIETCEGAQDIYALKKRYGDRLALHGNIDLSGVLAHGTPAQVTADTIEHCRRLSAGGGYICASSHNITEAVPLANFYALRDAALAFRR